MKTLQGVGCSVGEYVGDGQGEADISEQAVESGPLDNNNVIDEEAYASDNCANEGGDERHPLSLTVKHQHSASTATTTDIGAKDILSVSKPTFSHSRDGGQQCYMKELSNFSACCNSRNTED